MARVVNFNDGAESETTPVIGKIVASNLVQYPDDATYEATELDSPVVGNLYYNTTLDLIRYYNGTEWISLVDESSAQELSNKTIDADSNTITNLENENIKVGAAIDAEKIHDGSVTNTEFGYISTLTSNAQDQLDDKQDLSEKGQANGYASLDGSGLVPAGQLPSYVDDVLEFADLAAFPVTGETGKIYVAIDTGDIYRWSGTVYVQISASGANQELSNLTSPTAINQNLLPDTTESRSIGTLILRFFNGFFKNLYFEDGRLTRQNNNISINCPTVSSNPEAGPVPFAIQTLNDSTNNSTKAPTLYTLGSNKTAGTGDGGDVVLKSGTSAGGNPGKILLQDGTEGTVGHVWTSVGVNGAGSWQVGGSSGANQSLSNLTSPTSINQTLTPSTNVVFDLGSPTNRWRTANLRQIIFGNASGGANDELVISGGQNQQIPSGATVLTYMRTVNKAVPSDLAIFTATSTTNTGFPTKNIYIETGNKELGTEDSGSILLRTGTSAGGSRGGIQLRNGTEGTVGHVWKSTGVNGEGAWSPLISEYLEASGTFTPSGGAWSVGAAFPLTAGSWRFTYRLRSENASGATTQGIRINIGSANSTAASQDITYTVGGIASAQYATNNTRGGSGEISGILTIGSTTTYYAKAIAYNAAFVSPVEWILIAERLQ